MIITIGREYGSGGRYVGQKLAEKLGIKYYDKSLLSIEAKKSEDYDELRAFYEEEPISSLLYVIGTTSSKKGNEKPFNFIKEIAEKEDCVIIGRCGNFILQDQKDLVRVFVKADLEKRVQRVREYEDISEEKAKKRVQKVDGEREAFHKYYTEENWLDLRGYDLILNSSEVGLENVVDLILDFIERRGK